MNPPSQDIAAILEAESDLALAFAVNLHTYQMPDTPDACVCIYDSGGYVGQENVEYWKPTFQVKVRGAKGDSRTAYLLAQAIRDRLHAAHNETVNGARYIGIWMETDVLTIGPDQNARPQFTINFRADRTSAA